MDFEKSSWADWMTMTPAPTAEATLFTDRYLTSPTAKTPGMLVSIGRGRRPSGHPCRGRPFGEGDGVGAHAIVRRPTA